MNAKLASFAVGLMVIAGTAQAAITEVKFTQVDQAVIPDVVVNDVFVNVTGNIRTQAMILELTSGTIFQQGQGGGNTAPDEGFFGFVPPLQYDTFVTIGGPTSQTSSAVLVAGGAVNIDPVAVQKFDATGLNFSWAPGTGINVGNNANFMTARITLSSDAVGTLRYWGSTEGEDTSAISASSFQIMNGVIGGVDLPVFESSPAPGGTLDFGYGGQNRTLNLATSNTGGGTLEVVNAVIDGANADLFRVNNFAAYDLLGGAGPTNVEVEFLAEISGGPGTYLATLNLIGEGGAVLGTYSLTAQVPEPSTVALAGLGMVGLVGFIRRRR